MSWVLTVIGIIIALSILVVIHEGGHYLAARAFKVRVTEFMVGLPGPCVGFTRKGTKFGVTAVPLGGYCRIAGMEGGENDPLLAPALAYVWQQGSTDTDHVAAALHVDKEEASYLLSLLAGWGSITTPKGTLQGDTYLASPRGAYAKGEPRQVPDAAALLAQEREGTYQNLPWYKRLVILFAGPVFNLLAAILIFIIIYSCHGVYAVTNVLEDVVENSAAASAGLESGDEVIHIGEFEVNDYETFATALDEYAPGDTIPVTFVRAGQTSTVHITLQANEEGQAIMGVLLGYGKIRLPLGDSLKISFEYIGQVCKAIAGFFNPRQVAESVAQSSSVVGIAQVAHDMSAYGFALYLQLAAAVSVSLGLFNLLPIPPLDGGKILIEIIQAIMRREVSLRVVNAISMVGIALFVLLFVVLLQQDISRIVLGG